MKINKDTSIVVSNIVIYMKTEAILLRSMYENLIYLSYTEFMKNVLFEKWTGSHENQKCSLVLIVIGT